VNLVVNGDFESAMTDWANWGNASVAAGQGTAGSQAIRVGTAGGGAGEDIGSVTAGTVYRLSGQVKVSDASETGYLGVSFLDASGAALQSQSVPFSTVNYYGAQLDVRAPASAVRAQVYVWKNSGTGYAYLDDIALVPMAGFSSIKGVFIGNSISYSFPTATLQWNHASGMAASSAQTDYAHMTAAALNIGAPSITNFAGLERDPATNVPVIPQVTAGIDSSTAVTIELGDNATAADLPAFSTAYNSLLDAASHGRSLVCVSTWWQDASKDATIKSACESHGGTYVYIGDVRTDPANRDHLDGPQYADASVNDHPHDWSMAQIAARIAAATPK
jgi:hypothetical protein